MAAGQMPASNTAPKVRKGIDRFILVVFSCTRFSGRPGYGFLALTKPLALSTSRRWCSTAGLSPERPAELLFVVISLPTLQFLSSGFPRKENLGVHAFMARHKFQGQKSHLTLKQGAPLAEPWLHGGWSSHT